MPARLILLVMLALLARPASAASLFYTFQGTVTSIVEQQASHDNLVNPNDYVQIGQNVTYVLEIDFARPGQHTINTGNTFTIPDAGIDDYFFADLVRDVSSVTLPVPTLDVTTPVFGDLLMQYGDDVETGNVNSRVGWIFLNSHANEFRIFKVGELVSEWQVGSTVYALSKALIFFGNDTYYDSFFTELRLTSISDTRPGAGVPAPAVSSLLAIGLSAMLGSTWLRRHRRPGSRLSVVATADRMRAGRIRGFRQLTGSR